MVTGPLNATHIHDSRFWKNAVSGLKSVRLSSVTPSKAKAIRPLDFRLRKDFSKIDDKNI